MSTRRYGDPNQNQPGVFKRVTRGVADGLGVERKFVVIGLIICALFNLAAALILFGIGWLYVDKPGVLEKARTRAKTGWRNCKRHMPRRAPQPAETTPIDPEAHDPFFKDLRARFADLEKRAQGMEKYVTSEEFRLNREFRKL